MLSEKFKNFHDQNLPYGLASSSVIPIIIILRNNNHNNYVVTS